MTIKKGTFIIAEAGVNHNGSLDIGLQLIDAAADAGADAVKFQTFHSEALVCKHTQKAEYQTQTTDKEESQFDMLKKLELNENDHKTLMAHANHRNIEFLSTPFDTKSLLFLSKELGLSKIKISSGDITNAPFLLEVARLAEKIILSTGMSTLDEIKAALGVLAFGFLMKNEKPDRDSFSRAFLSQEGQECLHERVTLLHCTSEYPAPVAEVNLRSLDTLISAFDLAVGYSDHTEGIHISTAAVARGACVLEKHFTLDRSLPGPDHQASLEPHELRHMVDNIRDIEQAMGDGVKCPTKSELKNRELVRKSLVAACDISAGDIFTADTIASKRPGNNRSPFDYWSICGELATRNYSEDEPL